MDYKKVQEKYQDSLSQFDLTEYLNNSKHGELNFSVVLDSMNEISKVLYELEINDYRNLLPRNVINEIDGFRANIIQYFNLIKDFSISQSNASDIRSNYINQINTLYNNSFYRIDEILNNLKVRKLLQDNKGLDEQIRALGQVEEMTTALEKARMELEKKNEEIVSAANLGNKVGNLESSHYFTITANKHGGPAGNTTKWIKQRTIFFFLLIGWVLVHYFIYLAQGPYGSVLDIIEHGLFFLLGFVLLYFGFSFATSNYFLEKSLEIENKHRSNIADTAPLLQLGANTDSAKDIIITEQVKALFSPIGIGRIEGKGTEVTTPFVEIIKSLIGKM